MTALWLRLQSWTNAPIPGWAIAWFRGAYCSFMIVGVLAYGRGYDLVFKFLTKESQEPVWPLLPDSLFAALRPLTVVFLILSVVFIDRRLPVLLAWLTFTVYESQVAPYFRPYTTNLSFVVLGLLVFAPRTNYSNAKPVNGSCLRLAHLALALAYLSATAGKLLLDGSRWLDGARMTEILERNLLFTNSQSARTLLETPGAPMLLGIATIAFESLFFLSLFNRRISALMIMCGLVFHTAIFWILKINFFYFFMPAYLAPLLCLVSEDQTAIDNSKVAASLVTKAITNPKDTNLSKFRRKPGAST